MQRCGLFLDLPNKKTSEVKPKEGRNGWLAPKLIADALFIIAACAEFIVDIELYCIDNNGAIILPLLLTLQL